MAYRHSRANSQCFDDFFQEGAVGVRDAEAKHDPSKGHLDHFAVVCAQRRMLKLHRWLFSRRAEIPVGSLCACDGDESLPDEAVEAERELRAEASSYQFFDTVDVGIIWEIAPFVLTTREFEVMRLVYIDGLLSGEAAAALRISAPRVTQLVKSALTKLKNALFSKN